MIQAQPRLLALATSVPPFRLAQTEIQSRAPGFFAGANALDIDHLLPVFANAGIDARYSCVPLEWYDRPHGWAERNALYLENALDLLEKASRQALGPGRARSEPDRRRGRGFNHRHRHAQPRRAADGRLGLRRGYKAAAGVRPGLCRRRDRPGARGRFRPRLRPVQRVLFLVVELCALSFRKSDTSKSNVVATALVRRRRSGRDRRLRRRRARRSARSGEHTWPDSLGIMGWDVAEDGLKAIFSRDIPALVRRDLRAAALRFLARAGVGACRHQAFCLPSRRRQGADRAGRGLRPRAGRDRPSPRQVLRDYGNMSAATALFVLERTLASGAKGPMLMSALGPGFTAGFLLLDPP